MNASASRFSTRGLAAEAVVDHIGTTPMGKVLHFAGKAIVARDDRKLATVGAGKTRLVFARHRADHPRAQRPRPLAQQQTDATCRRVHKYHLTRPHALRAMQHDLRGHPLQHHRRCGLVAHVVGKHDHLVRGHRAHRRVGAGWRAGIRDAVARQQVRHSLAHVQHDTCRFHSDRGRRLDHPIDALPDVDVDVVHAHGRLADAHFIRSRRHDRDRFVAQHLGPAESRGNDCLCG